MVGSEARIRVSSVIVPFLIGTLKSTRIRTFLPFKSRSVMLRPATRQNPFDAISLSRSTHRLE